MPGCMSDKAQQIQDPSSGEDTVAKWQELSSSIQKPEFEGRLDGSVDKGTCGQAW